MVLSRARTIGEVLPLPEERTGQNSERPVLGQLVATLGMGGAENLAVQIANAHAAAGGRAHLIVLSGPGALSDRVAPDVILHYLGYNRESIRNPFRFLASVIRGYRLLSGVVTGHRIEILQTHLPDANLWGLLLALFRKCRVFVTIHSNLFFGSQERPGVTKVLVKAAYRLMFRRCDGVIAVSEEVKRSVLAGLGGQTSLEQRVHVVINGVPSPVPLAEGKRAEIREQWNVGAGEFFLVAAGRFHEAKNFACLVDSMALLKERGYFPKLVIGGDGPLRATVKAQITKLSLDDLIQAPGNISDLPAVLQSADCLVMSSIWEGLPLVLLEGMMCGLPVVGTRIKGLVEIVQEGVEGFLVESDDPGAMATAIAKLLDAPESGPTMGTAGRSVVQQKYGFERVYADLLEVFAN